MIYIYTHFNFCIVTIYLNKRQLLPTRTSIYKNCTNITYLGVRCSGKHMRIRFCHSEIQLYNNQECIFYLVKSNSNNILGLSKALHL